MDAARTRARAVSQPGSGYATPAGCSPLLLPFPGLRYVPERSGALSTLLAPPHTELATQERATLLASSPFVVTHLERPEYTVGGGARPAVLEWLRRGVLTQDTPGFYVVEQRAAGRAHRFLLGALVVGPLTDDRVYAHEATIDEAVRSRQERLRVTGVDSEPILLIDDDTGGTTSPGDYAAAAELIGSHVTHSDAGTAGVAVDVWLVKEPDIVERITRSMAARRLLIADGHHRYAAVRASAAESGREQHVLVAISDRRSDPVELLALHRALPQHGARALLRDAEVGPPQEFKGWHSLRARLAGLIEPSLLLVSGSEVRLVTPDIPTGAGAWVDDTLMRAGIDAHDVRYVADLSGVAPVGTGMAVALLPTPDLAEVLQVARRGEVMGHKTTSFRPKPIAGAVMRLR
ncbi:MAG: DUF1015 family protein [Janthinobacterium lividum]